MSSLHVIFGSGALGLTLAEELVARGHRVRLVNRSGRKTGIAGVESVAGEAKDPTSTRELCQGAVAVYNCAAPPYTDWPREYPALQSGILEGAAAAGARLVLAENAYVYGRVDGPMTEETPFRPVSKKGELRARLNEAALAAHRAGKVRVALGRGPDYFGPRAVVTTIYGEQVFYPALAGKPAHIFGNPDARHTFIYVKDFARGLAILGEREEAMGQSWHLPCPPPLSQRELLTKIYAATGNRLSVRALPGWMTKSLGVIIPIMRELAEMQYQWTMDYDFRHDRFDAAFGGAYTSHDDAVKETVEWFRKNPKR
jgi:nucleoside-diphosphate-sugar epimerase